MSEIDPDKLAALRRLAEIWLKRALTAAEVKELEAFARRAEASPGGSVAQVHEVTRSIQEDRPSVEAHVANETAFAELSLASSGAFPQNAVSAQQQQKTLTDVAATRGAMHLHEVDTISAAAATERVGQMGAADNLTSLLAVLTAFDAQR